MNIKITGKKMLAMLDAQVSRMGSHYRPAGPDDAVSGCYYSDEQGEPVCIIGHILHDLAVQNGVQSAFRPFFERRQDGTSLSLNATGFSSLARYITEEYPSIEFTERAKALAVVAQIAQDAGETWGNAANAAWAHAAREGWL